MQVVHKNEDEGSSSRITDPINFIICVRGIHRHLEEEHHERVGNRGSGI